MKRHLFGLAISAAIAFGGVSGASATTSSNPLSTLQLLFDTNDFYVENTSTDLSSFLTLLGNTYNTPGGYATIVSAFENATNITPAYVSQFLATGTQNTVTASDGDVNPNDWVVTLTFTNVGSSGTIAYSGGLQGAPASVSGTFSGSGAIAAPGPIAGAGLPVVLGLIGFGLYRRRNAVAA